MEGIQTWPLTIAEYAGYSRAIIAEEEEAAPYAPLYLTNKVLMTSWSEEKHLPTAEIGS